MAEQEKNIQVVSAQDGSVIWDPQELGSGDIKKIASLIPLFREVFSNVTFNTVTQQTLSTDLKTELDKYVLKTDLTDDATAAVRDTISAMYQTGQIPNAAQLSEVQTALGMSFLGILQQIVAGASEEDVDSISVAEALIRLWQLCTQKFQDLDSSDISNNINVLTNKCAALLQALDASVIVPGYDSTSVGTIIQNLIHLQEIASENFGVISTINAVISRLQAVSLSSYDTDTGSTGKTVYVDSVNGFTDGNGTAGIPYKSIQSAVDAAPALSGGCEYIIEVYDGTYDGFTIAGKSLKLVSNAVSPSIQVDGNITIDNSTVYIDSALTVSPTSGIGLSAQGFSKIYVSDTLTFDGGVSGIAAVEGSHIILTDSLVVNNTTDTAVAISEGSTLNMMDISGTGNVNGLSARVGATISYDDMTSLTCSGTATLTASGGRIYSNA